MAASLLALLAGGPAWGQTQHYRKPVQPFPAAAISQPLGAVRVIQRADGSTITVPVQVRQAGMQQPPGGPGPAAPDDTSYQIQLTPPGPQQLFSLESEKDLQERMRMEALERPQPERLEFPTYDPLSRYPFAGRAWPLQYEIVEPSYLCYGKLYFEDLNSERYGWDLGFVQPFVSAGKFFTDVALLPYHAGSDWRRHYECNAGYCLPGDPVPYRCFPPGLSATGAASQVGAALFLLAVFP